MDGIILGKIYGFKFRCSNAIGMSELSDILKFGFFDKPDKPNAPIRNNLFSNKNTIFINYSKVTEQQIPILGYGTKMLEENLNIIQINDSKDSIYPMFYNSENSSLLNTFIFDNRQNGKKYYFAITAYDFNIMSDFSDNLETYSFGAPIGVSKLILSVKLKQSCY